MLNNLTDAQIVGIGIIVAATFISIIWFNMVSIWYDVEKRKWQRMANDAKRLEELKEKV